MLWKYYEQEVTLIEIVDSLQMPSDRLPACFLILNESVNKHNSRTDSAGF